MTTFAPDLNDVFQATAIPQIRAGQDANGRHVFLNISKSYFLKINTVFGENLTANINILNPKNVFTSDNLKLWYCDMDAAGEEMIHVLEGSASVAILSQPSSSSPITLRAGEAIRITNGVQGNPFTAPSVTCRVQDMQIIPVHITTPLPAQRLLVQQRIEQPIPFEIQKGPAPINDTIAAAPSAGTIPGGIYIATTGSPPTVQTTIQVRLP